jgi:hypothetical protein
VALNKVHVIMPSELEEGGTQRRGSQRAGV